MKNLWKQYSYIFTISFFILGFFNIVFALIGFICLIMPLVFVAKDKDKTWCKHYCPRSSLLAGVSRKFSLSFQPVPKWITNGIGRRILLAYFSVNVFMIIMSTTMVSLDKRDPVKLVRFLIAFKLPWNMPQFLNLGVVPDWVIHLGFRVYSMMFTTTVIGLLLVLLYKAKTWCLICPMGTLSDLALPKPSKAVRNNL